MPHSATKVYKQTINGVTYGITPEDVSKVLGVETGDIGTLCTSNKINKWSKHKPIQNSSPVDLTEEGFVAADDENHIYYGLQINVTNDVFTDMHNSTFNYVKRPTAITPYFRLGDFNGYNHIAQPNPNGFLPVNSEGKVVIYTGSQTTGKIEGITVSFRENTDSGIDLSYLLKSSSQESLASILPSIYPCALIGDYITALQYDDGVNNVPKAIATLNGNNELVYTAGFYYIDTLKNEYDETQLQPGPVHWDTVSERTDWINKVSIVLCRVYNGKYLIPGVADDSTNIIDYWIRVTGDSVISSKACPVPDCTGIPLQISATSGGGSLQSVTFGILTYSSYSAGVLGIAESVDATGAADGTHEVNVSVTVKIGTNTPYTQNFVQQIPVVNGIARGQTVNLGWPEDIIPVNGNIVTVQVIASGDCPTVRTNYSFVYNNSGGTVSPQ